MTTTTTAPPLLSLRGVTKTFGAVNADRHRPRRRARRGRRARRRQRRGKSTLVKVLSGVHAPDSGTISFDGRPVTVADPSAAIALGIATVFQDLALCENLDVVGNLFLGQERGRMRLDEVSMEVRSWELLQQLSAKIPTVRIPSRRSPAASARPSPSRARCSATRRSSSSTSRPRPSGSHRPPRSSTSSSGSGREGSASS